MNWTESPMNEYGSITASHNHRKPYSVMVKVSDFWSSDWVQFLVKSLNFCSIRLIRRELWKNSIVGWYQIEMWKRSSTSIIPSNNLTCQEMCIISVWRSVHIKGLTRHPMNSKTVLLKPLILTMLRSQKCTSIPGVGDSGKIQRWISDEQVILTDP